MTRHPNFVWTRVKTQQNQRRERIPSSNDQPSSAMEVHDATVFDALSNVLGIKAIPI